MQRCDSGVFFRSIDISAIIEKMSLDQRIFYGLC